MRRKEVEMKNRGTREIGYWIVLISVIVLVLITCLAFFFWGRDVGKQGEIKTQHEAKVAVLNQDADTVNPRLSDKEMFRTSVVKVVAPKEDGLTDADTMNPHVKGADIGSEILKINDRHFKK